MTVTAVAGTCEPRFAPLRDVFASNLESGRDLGAAVAVTLDGRPVVDLWGGHADAARLHAWHADTLVLVMSVTKALTGICGNICIERGLLDPDAPVASYWPEFAAAGKDHVLVQHVFDHRAGLPDVPLEPGEWGDWNAVCAALAAQPPAWEPGAAHSYHAFSYGWLVGELIRRVTGRRPNELLQDEVCGPLQVEAWIGAPPSIDERLADVTPEAMMTFMDRRAEVPAANGFSNARSLARIFGVLACGGGLDGIQLLAERTIDDATSFAVTGPWHGGDHGGVFAPLRFARGFQLNSECLYMGPSDRAFGHAGGGGALAWADRESRVAFAYTPNLFEMDTRHMYDRAAELGRCVFACLG